jgi:hypothetical protein
MLRAGGNALAALIAILCSNGIGRHATVRRCSQLPQHPKAAEVGNVHPTDLEYVVRAHGDALPFGLAPTMINDGSCRHPVHPMPQMLPRPTQVRGTGSDWIAQGRRHRMARAEGRPTSPGTLSAVGITS